MSLLPATSHRNNTTPFWATAGQGAVGDVTEITAGSGISVANGTGPVATITNTGVNTITGTGIGVSGTTAITLTNTGVTSITAGDGISISGGTGAVTITNTGSADIWALSPISQQSTTANVPVALATQVLGKQYTYAEGYGFLVCNGVSFATQPTITVYLTSGGSAGAINTAKSVGYILQQPDGGPSNYSGQFLDLSTIKHYDPAGFGSITLTFVATLNGTSVGFFPNISTSGFTNSTTADVVVTKGLTPTIGGAGFKFFTTV